MLLSLMGLLLLLFALLFTAAFAACMLPIGVELLVNCDVAAVQTAAVVVGCARGQSLTAAWKKRADQQE